VEISIGGKVKALMLSRSIYPVPTVGIKHNNPKVFILFIGGNTTEIGKAGL
jgi:hypothetical protein